MSATDVFEKGKKKFQRWCQSKGHYAKIALDDQLFSVIHDVGFRTLIERVEPRYAMPSRWHFSDVCLPELYDVVATHVRELIAPDISQPSASDRWGSDVSLTNMLSLYKLCMLFYFFIAYCALLECKQ